MEPTESGTDGTEQSTSGNANWTFPALLVLMLIVLFGIARWQAQPVAQPLATQQSATQSPTAQPSSGQVAAWIPTQQPTGETVSLSVDFGNGATKEFAALPWSTGMTVADLLAEAQKYRPGVKFAQSGTGASGFLSSLDGLANEGVGGRNWLYRVDDRHAHQSFCLEKIEPGMHILWTFTDEQYNDQPAEK